MVINSIFPNKPISKGCDFISGYAFKSSDFVEKGIPVVKIKNIQNGTVDFKESQFIPEELWSKKLNKFKVNHKDVLIAMTGQGSVGRVGQVRIPEDQYGVLNQRVGKFICDDETLTRDYLFYVISCKTYEDYLFNKAIGSGQPNLSPSDIIDSLIPYPPLKEQQAIASILSSLDDKIELNLQMNKTLEEMAMTLYKEWFVDFGPFKNGNFVESELGLIPEGWEVGEFEQLMVLQRGFDLPQKDRIEGEFPVFAASGKSTYHNEFKVKGPGVVTGRSGVLGNVFFINEDFWPLNTVLWVKEFKRSTPIFSYLFLLGFKLKDFNAGSAVPTLNRNDIHRQPVILPPKEMILKFESLVKDQYDLISINNKESEILTQTRDTLLPKLISGEIRVKDIEKEIAEVL